MHPSTSEFPVVQIALSPLAGTELASFLNLSSWIWTVSQLCTLLSLKDGPEHCLWWCDQGYTCRLVCPCVSVQGPHGPGGSWEVVREGGEVWGWRLQLRPTLPDLRSSAWFSEKPRSSWTCASRSLSGYTNQDQGLGCVSFCGLLIWFIAFIYLDLWCIGLHILLQTPQILGMDLVALEGLTD